jgi:hypothetical protein
VIAGVCRVMVAMLILLCLAFSFNLTFGPGVELQLYWAFAASSMHDPGAFAVKNSMEGASKGFVGVPALRDVHVLG